MTIRCPKIPKPSATAIIAAGLSLATGLIAILLLGGQITFDAELDAAENRMKYMSVQAEKRMEEQTVQTFQSYQRQNDVKTDTHLVEYYSDRVRDTRKDLMQNPSDPIAKEDLHHYLIKKRAAEERVSKSK